MIADATLLYELTGATGAPSTAPDYARAVPIAPQFDPTAAVAWTVQSVAWNLCSGGRCIATCYGTAAESERWRKMQGVHALEQVAPMYAQGSRSPVRDRRSLPGDGGAEQDDISTAATETPALPELHRTHNDATPIQHIGTVFGGGGGANAVQQKKAAAPSLPNGPLVRSPTFWNLARIAQRSLPLQNSISQLARGAGVNAYMLDTGIDPTHTELAGRVVLDYDAIGNGRGAVDCNGHGTHTAGIVGGTNVGVAPEVTLHSVAVLNCDGSGSTASVIAGLDWVAANFVAPAAVSMSLGMPSVSASVNAAVNALYTQHGIAVFVAAGNSVQNACSWSPASAQYAYTVGASDQSDALAYFSNYGPCVQALAPGVNVTSAYYVSPTALVAWAGTSMAAPHATGTAAVLHSLAAARALPLLSAAQVYAALNGGATTTALKTATLTAKTPDRLVYELLQPPTTAATVATTTAPIATTTAAPRPSAVGALRATAALLLSLY
jgi:subtilisin family serine protease